MRLKPDIYQQNIFNINYKKLKKEGITCLIFDLDNTLGLLEQKRCPKKTKELIEKLKEDFQVIIISNNLRKRIQVYKKQLGIDAVSLALKPFTFGLRRIKKNYNLNKKEMIMIGDQLVTDILSAKIFHIKSVLVEPLGKKDLKITNLNRKIEEKIVDKYTRKGVFERGKFYE